MRSSYRGKSIVVTGGLGFIGSNLAIRLVELGARVTIIDSKVRCCGANEHNIQPVAREVSVVASDIADAAQFRKLLAAADVIFNLAGDVSHIHSLLMPQRDQELNACAQLRFVEGCARWAPGVRIVYAGTRQVYGIPLYLPVDEDHPIQPVDTNGIHKYSAMMYHLQYTRSGALDGVVLNLTNVYGPRLALGIPCQGVLSTIIRRLARRRPVEIWGDGRQLRDPLYVDDAVKAFLAVGAAQNLQSRSFNIGGPSVLQLREIVGIAHELVGGPAPEYRPFPHERKVIDIGSYYSDCSRIERELGWKAATPFDLGIRRTFDFYRTQLRHYVDPAQPTIDCKLMDSGPTGGMRRRSAR